jgi:hypothetical protein
LKKPKIDVWANSYADEIREGYSEKKFLKIQKKFHDKLFEILKIKNLDDDIWLT